MNKTIIIIAEIGENHGGNWDLARKMVVAAAENGADIVKFQSYLGAEVAEGDPEKDWFTKVQLPDELHFEFKKLAEEHGVEFVSTPFSLGRTKFLIEELGLKKIKIASSEMLNFGMLDYLNGRVETAFLSTGLADLDEVKEAVSHLDKVEDLYILQCTTQYPCPPEEANLSVIETYKQVFPKHRIGFSDHTLGIIASVVAVALGAEVIEKHFTLDKSLPGTDHVFSVTPNELRSLVRQVREAEVLLGTGVKRSDEEELAIREFVRSRFPKS